MKTSWLLFMHKKMFGCYDTYVAGLQVSKLFDHILMKTYLGSHDRTWRKGMDADVWAHFRDSYLNTKYHRTVRDYNGTPTA